MAAQAPRRSRKSGCLILASLAGCSAGSSSDEGVVGKACGSGTAGAFPSQPETVDAGGKLRGRTKHPQTSLLRE